MHVTTSRIVFLSAARGVWGAEESLLTLASALRATGHEVDIVCFAGALASAWQTRVGTAPLIAPEPSQSSQSKDASVLWRRYLEAKRRHDAVVLFSYFLVLGAALARAATVGSGITIVLDMHDVLARRRGRTILRALSSACHAVISVSRFTAVQFGSRRRGMFVLTRPIERQRIRPMETQHDVAPSSALPLTTRVGIIGRLVVEKGHDLTIKAMVPLRDSSVLVVRGGADPSRPDEAAAIHALGNSLLGTSYVAEGEVPAIDAFADLDVLVVANSSEPLGRTVLEAQMSRVPVVVPDTGGSSELVTDGRTGYLYTANDRDALTLAIRRALSGDQTTVLDAAEANAVLTTDPLTYAEAYASALTSSAR